MEFKYTHLYRVVFVEDWGGRTSKVINLINLDQQWLSHIYSENNTLFYEHKETTILENKKGKHGIIS